ncbi:MAG: hypothetical protein Q9160_002224 [Pyrenula sp. 1 TL-2023]
MDPPDPTIDHDAGEDQHHSQARQLPDDLPKSLDDRRTVSNYGQETEIYDAWQVAAQPLSFNLSLDEPIYDEEAITSQLEDSDTRLMGMLAAQAAHREDVAESHNEEAIADDPRLEAQEKRRSLQKSLNMAASNGDVERINRLTTGKAQGFVDVNQVDEEGTGHQEVVSALIEAGAMVDKQDRNQWSALMWAMTNRHKGIAKVLLDNGASPDIRSSSGGTAFDFVQPGSDFSRYLYDNGYNIGNVGMEDDFYDSGFAQDRFEEEMAEDEMKRRMLMKESAANLEVDLSTLGFDEKPESPASPSEDEEEFVWDRCIGDQMFVFQEPMLPEILCLIINQMAPQRNPSQKPVPANLLFLMARYAHYHMTEPLLASLLGEAMDRINNVVEKHQWDMTMLAFWISNATLLLHYLKKDVGLSTATAKFQIELAELINEIFILIIRDAERRINKVLETAMLDHETIPGFEDVAFQGEWKLLKSKPKTKAPEPIEKRYRPPSPKRRAQTSPRNITSLLSSTLFVLDLYDVHSVIAAQILAQLFYWLGAELFNRVMLSKRYLSRTKAMQIRMNVSVLEDWARSNNRQPEHYENGSTMSSGQNTVEAARQHLAPVTQLLQWLQCFSSLGEDFDSLVATLLQLQRLSPTQLIHAAKNYRLEVGEKGLPKSAMKYLVQLQKGQETLIKGPVSPIATPGANDSPSLEAGTTDAAALSPAGNGSTSPKTPPATLSKSHAATPSQDTSHSVPSDNLILDPSLMLPFSLPTSTDMLITYGAGIGGMNRERERKYIPTVPTEVLAKLGLDGDDTS